MQSEGDDSFVSISLDSSECEICLQDTGEPLATCDICARHLTRHLTQAPVQEGFNQIPDLVHVETRAHATCFRKFHKLARRLARNAGSPKHCNGTGACATGDYTSASGAGGYNRAEVEYTGSSTPGDYRPPVASTPGGYRPPGDVRVPQKTERDQWLNFNTNNLGSELLLENIRNRVSRSNPGSRRGSPVFSGTGSRPLLDQERCRSEPELDHSLSAQELRRSYAKYLFGWKQEEEGENKNQSLESRTPSVGLKQTLEVTGETPFGGVSKENPYQTDQVPNVKDVGEETCNVVPEPKGKSCQSDLQYLEPVLKTKLDSCQDSVRENGTRAVNEQGHDHVDSDEPRLANKDNCSGLTDFVESEMGTCRNSGNESKNNVITDPQKSEQSNGTKKSKPGSVKDSCGDDHRSSSLQTDSKESETLRSSESDDSALKLDSPYETRKGRGLTSEWWREVGRITNIQLHMMSTEQLEAHAQTLNRAVNDAGSQLVQLLQEKDVISSEVSSRHVTIKKLVQRQTTLHH